MQRLVLSSVSERFVHCFPCDITSQPIGENIVSVTSRPIDELDNSITSQPVEFFDFHISVDKCERNGITSWLDGYFSNRFTKHASEILENGRNRNTRAKVRENTNENNNNCADFEYMENYANTNEVLIVQFVPDTEHAEVPYTYISKDFHKR